MKLVTNAGSDSVLELLRAQLTQGGSLDMASAEFSLFAFAALQSQLAQLDRCRLALAADRWRAAGWAWVGASHAGGWLKETFGRKLS